MKEGSALFSAFEADLSSGSRQSTERLACRMVNLS